MNSVKKLMFRRSACTGLRCRDMITVICGVTKFKECDGKPFFDNSDVASIHPNGIKSQKKHLTMNRIIVIAGEIITYAIQTREMGKKKNSKMIAT